MNPTPDESATVREVARFYLNPFEALLLAIIRAEGGPEALIRAVQCSKPEVNSFAWAVAITCKTIRRVLDEFRGDVFDTAVGAPRDPWTGEANPRALVFSRAFIEALGARWAPIGVANDPTNLNRNWVPNVLEFLDPTGRRSAPGGATG